VYEFPRRSNDGGSDNALRVASRTGDARPELVRGEAGNLVHHGDWTSCVRSMRGKEMRADAR
jgi:hypothetical protein